ncbi:hypothetical protein JOF53_004348 [Crossiella equi]|uniref:Integral membrane protein n=1 Tax=Crossiella equi TaxID=130796 RepID=A0ABS5AGK1_9PSEU|nr:hypothetical protein [Crossiella equi]MBP2475476.1 hypothetical protein [Crossiella equi]
MLLGHSAVAWVTAGVLWSGGALEFPFAMGAVLVGAAGLVLALLLPAWPRQLRTMALWFAGLLIPVNLMLGVFSVSALAGAVVAAVAFVLLLRPVRLAPFHGSGLAGVR